jgi:hypothetical protein
MFALLPSLNNVGGALTPTHVRPAFSVLSSTRHVVASHGADPSTQPSSSETNVTDAGTNSSGTGPIGSVPAGVGVPVGSGAALNDARGGNVGATECAAGVAGLAGLQETSRAAPATAATRTRRAIGRGAPRPF